MNTYWSKGTRYVSIDFVSIFKCFPTKSYGVTIRSHCLDEADRMYCCLENKNVFFYERCHQLAVTKGQTNVPQRSAMRCCKIYFDNRSFAIYKSHVVILRTQLPLLDKDSQLYIYFLRVPYAFQNPCTYLKTQKVIEMNNIYKDNLLLNAA